MQLKNYQKIQKRKEKKPYDGPNKKSDDDKTSVDTSKGQRLKKMAAKKEEVKFVKQVTLRPRERSKRKRKSELVNHSELSKKNK